MSGPNEMQGVLEVRRALKQRFPHVPGALVDEVVTREYSALAGPVRTFIPILLEKAARRRLTELDHEPEAGAA